MKNILNKAKELEGKILEYRRYLHENPELSMDLPNTNAFVVKTLNELGIENKNLAGYGVVALIGGKKPGKTILLRADMDALPVPEEVDLEFKSKTPNVMHACGHDIHTASLLGAAEILKSMENELEGTVKLMFQPAEETLIGAKNMVEAGALEDPKVDAAFMIHVFTGNPLKSGMVGISDPGPFSSASDWFTINIQGKGGHSSAPEHAIDPLNIAAHLHIALQALNSREISALDKVVLTIGHMSGGLTNNVIPDTAILEGTIRSYDPKVREFVQRRIVEISEFTAKTFRGEATVEFTQGISSVINDKDSLDTAREVFTELLGEENVMKTSDFLPSGLLMGSEDFSYVADRVPGVMIPFTLGDSRDDRYKYPHHHPKTCFDEEHIFEAAAGYAAYAVRWLEKHK